MRHRLAQKLVLLPQVPQIDANNGFVVIEEAERMKPRHTEYMPECPEHIPPHAAAQTGYPEHNQAT